MQKIPGLGVVTFEGKGVVQVLVDEDGTGYIIQNAYGCEAAFEFKLIMTSLDLHKLEQLRDSGGLADEIQTSAELMVMEILTAQLREKDAQNKASRVDPTQPKGDA